MSQRDMVRQAVARDNQRDVTPLRPPGDRRQRHRNEGEDACIYCGAPIVDDELLRMACPALLGQPLPTHARPGMRVKVGDEVRLSAKEASILAHVLASEVHYLGMITESEREVYMAVERKLGRDDS